MKISILHITDVHITKFNVAAIDERVQSLLKSVVKEGFTPQVIVITGDAAAKGISEEYVLFHDHVVRPIITDLELDTSRVFIVPGNHDVDRTRIDPVLQAGLKHFISQPTEMDDLWREPTRRQSIVSRQEAFFTYATSQGLGCTSRILDFQGVTVGFACINSAWLSASDSDRSSLAITRAQLDAAHNEIASGDLRVALWHHPLAWLDDSDASRVRTSLSQKFNLCVTGHLHDADGVQLASPDGETILVAGPALFAPGDKGGYMLYELDAADRSLTAHALRWNEKAATYVRNTELAENGVWQRSFSTNSSLSDRAISERRRAADNRSRDCGARLARRLPPITIGKRQLSPEERFLEPNLVLAMAGRKRKFSVQEVVQEMGSLVIEAFPQSGKTALLERLVGKLTSVGKVAVLSDFHDVKEKYRGKPGLCEFFSVELGVSKKAAQAILQGDVVILLDNCILAYDRAEWQILSSWRTAIPGLKVIAAGRPLTLPRSRDELTGKWKWLSIHPMTVQLVRKEITRLEQLSSPDAQSAPGASIQGTLATILEAELPRWPWVILLFFELTQRLGVSNLRSVEGLLRKYTDLRLGAYESAGAERPKVRGRMLRLLATEMIERPAASIRHSDAIAVFEAEIVKCGLEESGEALLAELIESQLLTEDEGGVAFSFFILQEYFHAEYLRETLWNDVAALSLEDVVRKSGALVLFAEMVQAPQLLKRCLEISKAARGKAPPESLIESLVHLRLSAGGADAAVETARAAILHDDEVEDLILDSETQQQGTRERRSLSSSDSMGELEKFIHAFATAVAVMRGSRWIDKPFKHESVGAALDLAVCVVSEITADEELLRAIASVEVDPARRKKVIAVVNAILVLVVANMLAVLGAGQHLIPTIREMFSQEKDDLRRLMLLMWYMEVGGTKRREAVDEFVTNAKSAFAVQLATMWLYSKFVLSSSFDDGSKVENEALLRIAAEEQAKRIARQPEIPGSDTTVTAAGHIKAEAERIVQRARHDRDLNKSTE